MLIQKKSKFKIFPGSIKSNLVINATGVWGSELLKPLGIALPLIAFKHSYVVSEAIPGLHQMTPNIRDHDNSIVFRIQGKAFNLGGYEKNPILLESVPSDFQFSLYDLDYSTFDEHIEGAMELIPAFKDVGIKSTICGPESFTPDHRPLIVGFFFQILNGFHKFKFFLGSRPLHFKSLPQLRLQFSWNHVWSWLCETIGKLGC